MAERLLPICALRPGAADRMWPTAPAVGSRAAQTFTFQAPAGATELQPLKQSPRYTTNRGSNSIPCFFSSATSSS